MAPSRWKLIAYGLVVVLGIIFAAPNFLNSSQLAAWPNWLPQKQIALGLDLKGGAHLVLEIDSESLRREQLQSLAAETRSVLRDARIRCTPVTQTSNEVEAICANSQEARLAMAKLQRGTAHVSIPQDRTTVVSLRPTTEAFDQRRRSAIEQSREIVRKRIDSLGVAEASVESLGRERILVQLPGVPDPAEIRKLLGSTAKLTFHRVHEGASQPSSSEWVRLPGIDGKEQFLIEASSLLQGERLKSAGTGRDPRTGLPTVTFNLDGQGAKQFAAVTGSMVGKAFAIVLDGTVISAPIVREPIVTGAVQIGGPFSSKDAASLAALLRAGALPVAMNVVDQGTVSADLGASAIRMGAVTGGIGLMLVLTFMTVLYRAWGLVANLALIINVALTLALATALNVTLTLPGIAGIVLGIGLAVDANVLINERIREETRLGKTAVAAVQSGFRRAYAAILDSNVTTLIATILLFSIGSGPVQGFAITMALGIGISMFTAVSVVHAVMATWVAKRKPETLRILSFLPQRLQEIPRFAFMRARFVGIGVSLVLSALSIGLMINPGLNYGVDFTGGVMIQTQMPASTDLGRMERGLRELGVGEAKAQRVIGSSTVLVRLKQPPSTDDVTRLEFAELAKSKIAELEPTAEIGRTDVTSPRISAELASTGILAVLAAAVAMFIYICIRFQWHFAASAIVTLMLDITKVIGFFVLTRIEFNVTAIAAVLTLIGYSVNDKVVVYDRLRENLRNFPNVALRELID
ncbi:MAG TPA: protein translocase subunit SecD, partial [Steroidobacteraceae bacterium]|nr:protein translocase subunit SecD [Steroidobacteraceae bacterium]